MAFPETPFCLLARENEWLLMKLFICLYKFILPVANPEKKVENSNGYSKGDITREKSEKVVHNMYKNYF